MADVDLSQLDALIARLRRSREFLARAAPAAAEAMQAELRASASAGTSPEGAAWAEKKGGGRALPNAASAITVKAVGTILLGRLVFPYTLHNIGKGNAPQRQVIPAGAMPPRVLAAIKRALIAAWEANGS